MSARRHSAAPQNFSSIIFSYENLGVPLCLETYNHLLNDISQLSDILTDNDTSIKFLSDFEVYTKRIAQFFTIVKNHSADAARQHQGTTDEGILREKIVEKLLLPLFGDDFKKFHSGPAFMDLIVSKIQFNIPLHPGALKPLTECLGAKRELLGLLISGEGSSSVMKDWIATFRSNISNLKIFESWTSTFITLCKNCENNHGISQEIQRWHKLGELKERLKVAQEQLRNNTESNKFSRTVSSSMMRNLVDDKKSVSGSVTQAPTADINLSTADLILLRAFDIAPPSSERGLILALEKLENDETLSIMQKLVDSFPCKLCSNRGESHTSKYETLSMMQKNSRADRGTLSFSSFVMELLCTEFPTMVDELLPEIGQYCGPKPTILVNFGSFFTKILKSVELRPRGFNLSAEQVIIVRDDREKETLIDDIGPNRKILILTVLESKGMEFDEVFLIDFFTTSECHSSFRALARQKNIDGLNHVSLCAELKKLYVVTNRPKSRLWLIESDPSSVNSIVNLLKKKPNEHLIDVEYTDTDEKIKTIVKQMCCGKTSNPRDWSKRGREFLHRQDYDNAKFCFENADDARGKVMTQAFIEEQRGRNHRALHNEEDFVKCFRAAAKLYHESDLPLKEATCFEALGKYREAAAIFLDQWQFEKAANLYERAKCYEEASNNYVLAENYDEGAGALLRGGLFEELVCYLNKHRDFINSNTRSHYSKLCNLQWEMSSDLGTIPVEALQPHPKKETFRRVHHITDRLKDFYVAKKRYPELFDVVVENEEIENAWSLVEKYNLYRQIPQKDLTEVFNYIQSRSLYEELTSEPNTVLSWNEKLYPRNLLFPQIFEMRRPWEQLAGVINDFQNRIIDCESIRFEESWMKGLFSIIVTIKATYFIDAANKLSKLPIEFINEVTDMVKLLSTEGKIAPSLLLFLGIFPVSEKTGTYRLLDWSPLNSGLDLTAKNLDTPAIVDKVCKWALDHLHPAIMQIHEKAKALYRDQYPKRCCSYLTTLSCRNMCEYSHRLITQENFADSIKDLLRTSSIYNTFMLLYYRYARQPDILDQEFAKPFMGHHRGWLERITAQITFFSSFEHDAGILMKTYHEISCESSEFFGILGELEILLFHRIRHDWNNKHSISYLLEQLQHAENLGVADRFMKCLSNAFMDSPQYPSKTHARNTLREIRNLRYEKVPGTPETHRQYDKIFWMLEQFSIEEFPSFHAVISFYEKLATFLIYMSRPSEFLIPNSWVQMYLVQMPGLFTEETQVGQSRMSLFQVQQMRLRENSDFVSQHWYQQSLLRAVESFCNMIRYIRNHDAVTTMFAGSLKPKPRQYLARRQIDFLAVTMTNLRSMLPQPRDVARVWYTVHTTVAILSANEGDWGKTSPQTLAINLFESFKRYNNKDVLLIVTQGGRNSRVFPGLHSKGVASTSMDSIWSSRLRKATASVPASNAESQLNIDYSEKEKWAAGIIQNFCRTRYPKVRQRREFLASPTGKVHVFIQKLREKILKRNLSPRERLERVVLLVRDGTELYQRVKGLEDRFREIRKISKEEFTNEALTADQLEDLQDLWEELPKIKQKVRQEVKMYTEKNEEWLDWSPKDLEANYADTNGFLDAVEAELNQRTKELEEIC